MNEHAERSADPRYPELNVRVQSPNPLVLVSAVRYALWQAGVSTEQINTFSQQALQEHSERGQRQVCAHWVTVTTAVS